MEFTEEMARDFYKAFTGYDARPSIFLTGVMKYCYKKGWEDCESERERLQCIAHHAAAEDRGNGDIVND